MSELQRLVRIHYGGVNSGDFDAAGSVFAEDCETTSPYGTLRGTGAIRQMGEAFRAAAPDNRIEALRTWEAGDSVIEASPSRRAANRSPSGTMAMRCCHGR